LAATIAVTLKDCSFNNLPLARGLHLEGQAVKGEKKMKTKLIATLLLAGSSLFAAPRIRFGVGIGVPAPVVVAPPIVAYAPPCPGPGYSWIGGSWVFVGGGHFYDRDHYRGPVYRDHDRGRDFRRR
jgi:hypothetical protein